VTTSVRATLVDVVCVSVITSYVNFFFFQAEDGIRDATVTGVQTCALPISSERRTTGHRRGCPSCARRSPGTSRRHAARRSRPRRSEERRVGEEGRCGGAAWYDKKKEERGIK